MSHTERMGQRSTRSGTSKHECGRCRTTRWANGSSRARKDLHSMTCEDDALEASALQKKLTRSMRHQHWHRHGTENAAGDAAENEFAQARMSVAAHHRKVGAAVGDIVENHVADRDVALGDALDLRGNAMAREMLGHVGAGNLVVLALLGDDENVDRLGA